MLGLVPVYWVNAFFCVLGLMPVSVYCTGFDAGSVCWAARLFLCTGFDACVSVLGLMPVSV